MSKWSELNKVKKDKTKKKNIAGGTGIGNTKRYHHDLFQDDVKFDDYIGNKTCITCDQIFDILAIQDDKGYCMNCFNDVLGGEVTMSKYNTMSAEDKLSWETPIKKETIRDMLVLRRFNDRDIINLENEMITLGIESFVHTMGMEICEQRRCDPDKPKTLNFNDDNMRIGLKHETFAVLQNRKENGHSKNLDLMDDDLYDYVKGNLERQTQEVGENACNYLKYLITLYNHFKHTTIHDNIVGSFANSNIYDLQEMEPIQCPFTDDPENKKFTIDASEKLIMICREVMSNEGYFDNGNTQSINHFNKVFDEKAHEKITYILADWHNTKGHQKVDALREEQMSYMKKINYPMNFEEIEKLDQTLVYCHLCNVGYNISKSSVKIHEAHQKIDEKNKTIEEIVEGLPNLDKTFLMGEIKQQKKKEKLRNEKKKYVSLGECIRILAELHIYNQTKLLKAKKDKYAKNIPKDPKKHYRDGFKWSSVKTYKPNKKAKTYEQLETALRQLKENWKFYERKPDGFFLVLFDDWQTWKATDPFHQRFFSEFINLRQSPEGRRELFEALSIGRFDMQFGHFVKSVPSVSSIKSLQFSNDVTKTIDDKEFDELLDGEDHELGVNKILSETDDLIPMDKDSEAYKLHVRIIIQELWMAVLKNGFGEKIKILKLRKTMKSTLAKHIISKFLAEYSLIKMMQDEIKESDYRGFEPNPMQLYGAWMVNAKGGYGNFSSTGTGKTDMAIISSRITNSYNTLVVCPDTIKDQWEKMILHDYPLSDISISRVKGNPIFPDKGSSNKYKYHMINFQKFGREASADELLDEICKTRVDMVIIDEAQNIKQREELEQSNTRENIEILLERLRERKPKLKVIFLTATPVINNLTEGVKLLEMIANKKFPHLKTANKIRNASRLYMEYLEYSLRFKIDYNINVVKSTITTQTNIPTRIGADVLRKYNYSDWEILCTPDRIPEMIKIGKKHGKAIIYTEFVSIVVDQIRDAFEKEINPKTGKFFRVGEFTGNSKEGLIKKTDQKGVYTNPFQNGDIDILIASSPIAEGIDGLQKVCSCVMFNGVTWTFAKYEQIVGRIVRTGQPEDDVYLYQISSRIENYDFDQRIKIDRLHAKEMLQLCVLDGQIPNIKAWERGTKDYYHDFIECVIKDQKSRVATKEELKKSGVTELA